LLNIQIVKIFPGRYDRVKNYDTDATAVKVFVITGDPGESGRPPLPGICGLACFENLARGPFNTFAYQFKYLIMRQNLFTR